MEEVTGDVEQTIKRQYALHFIPTLQKHSLLLLHKRHKQYRYIYCVAKFLWIINQLIGVEMFSMLHVALRNSECRNNESLQI
jgi:hypothetical protein